MLSNDCCIRREEKKDFRAVEELTRDAFWNVYRPGCFEHYVLHCLRNDPAFVPELDYVLEVGGELIGQVVYVRSEIICDDGRKVPIMTFGPIGIAPACKRRGYGKRLLDFSMERAKEMGVGALAITGNIDFYGKSGFVPAKSKGVRYADDPDADSFSSKNCSRGSLTAFRAPTATRRGISSVKRTPPRLSGSTPPSRKKKSRRSRGNCFRDPRRNPPTDPQKEKNP